MDDDVPTSDTRFRCPGCDEDVDVSPDAVGQLVRCPYCNTDFFAAPGLANEAVVDDTDPPPPDDGPPPHQLDSLRIRQLSALRQATLRIRSWWIITLALAAITAVDLLSKAAYSAYVLHAWSLRSTLLTIGGAAPTALAIAAARQARRVAREAGASSFPPPPVDPDFTTLDNGSDRWRHLEEIR